MTASDQVHVGIRWVGASMATTQLVRLLTTAVLARLLTPEIFGLVAMAHVAIQLIGVIREVGIGSAYVQRPDRGPEDAALAADTTFYLSLLANGVLFLLAWLAAPLIVRFFEAEGLLAVLRAMFLVFLIQPLDTTPSMILQKRLEFDKGALAEIVASAVNTVVAIGLAVAGFGVWSLVAGQLASRSARAGAVLRFSGFRPRLRFDRAIAGQLFAYGRYLWAFAILSAVGGTIDRMILGRALGAATLGMYEMAFNLSSLPSTHVSRLVNQITFPSFARVQADLPALRAGLHKTLRHVSMLSVPLAFGMLAVAEDLILTVYGDQWRGAIPIIRVLAFFGLALSISSIMGPVLKAIGKPQILLYSSILHHALLFTLLYFLARYGAVGIAWAVVIPMVVSAFYAYALIVHYLKFPVRDLLGPLLRAGVPSLGMYWIVRLFDARLDAALVLPVPLSLLASVGVGAAAYLLLSAVLNRDGVLELLATARQVLVARGGTSRDAASS